MITGNIFKGNSTQKMIAIIVTLAAGNDFLISSFTIDTTKEIRN